jgi:hypothetical protein
MTVSYYKNATKFNSRRIYNFKGTILHGLPSLPSLHKVGQGSNEK